VYDGTFRHLSVFRPSPGHATPPRYSVSGRQLRCTNRVFRFRQQQCRGFSILRQPSPVSYVGKLSTLPSLLSPPTPVSPQLPSTYPRKTLAYTAGLPPLMHCKRHVNLHFRHLLRLYQTQQPMQQNRTEMGITVATIRTTLP
jgi:hypothetical protein